MPPHEKVNAGIRLGSMFIDQFFMMGICMLFFLPITMNEAANVIAVSHEHNAFFVNFQSPFFYIGVIGLALYFCKDAIDGRSVGKRLTKLQVVDNKTGAVASPLQCFVRNIFCIIWPLEGLIVLLENPARRIGDRVAGTKVVFYDPATANKTRIDLKKLLLSLAMAFIIVLLSAFLLNEVQPSIPKVNYVKSSYNDQESKTLEKLYADSLGQNLTASVRVYDTISNSKLKYISVIYELKGDYLEDYDTRRSLTELTMKHMYSLFPENTFTGWAQYVFHDGGTFQTVNNAIGVRIITSPDN